MLPFLISLACALVAALLGVAAARRRRWLLMQVCGIASALGVYTCMAVLVAESVVLT